ncbi:aminodeoxychorismate/anthranilate synthase component II [Glycocaulis sp.]|uniref:anthranilate synthase component II n=1 Tax=Glycocaulis sp. TaxID=1969725 RepID=UPI0025C3E3C1|nr:aminodeoxychorismate/anthranilate synthase component II [Glycocaulis sp.]MCH8521388.1 aminodeoxychorismate/anthranilate synthase component II [Glycocaulis sp.]
MLLIIDNYDSFTFNLVHYFQELGANTRVIRNDDMSAGEALSLGASAIVISPGPCDPDRAGICLELIGTAPGSLPILGVCLGHQAIGQAFGGKVVAAREIMHGKTSPITHDGTGVFAGLPSPYEATRYHSLAVELSEESELIVNARTADGEIMGLMHKTRPIHGVQFHPESIASEHGHALLANFLALSGLATDRAA